jgi:ATP-dependent protease ClpP protease subunit
MNFLHTIDPTASEPIMLLDDEVGYNPETGTGISASQFCKELMFLDSIGKNKINIWINSPGGSVVEGMQIFNTILKVQAKVDTHNVGMCASIAASIFLAGRNRYAMDNSVMMIHPVSGGTKETNKVFENCVNMMLSSRSYLTPSSVKKMMDATTWLSAQECNELGLCEIDVAREFNKPRQKPDLTNVSNAHNVYREYVNSAIKPIKVETKINMKNIANKLELVDDAAETSIVKAIDFLQNKANVAESNLSEAKAKLDEASNNYNQLKADYDKLVAEREAEKVTAIANEAKAEIANAVKLGKIKNEAEVITKWENNYKANPANTKELLESMGVSKSAPKFPASQNNVANDAKLEMSVANTMAEIRNKLETSK